MRTVSIFFQRRQSGFKRFISSNLIDLPQILLSYRKYVGSQHGSGLSCRNLLLCAWKPMGSVHRSNWTSALENPFENKASQHVFMSTYASHIKRPKKKREGPMRKKVQAETQRILAFENIVERDDYFRFLTKSKEWLAKEPEQVLHLDEAGKMYRELGFARGRKVTRYVERHPALFELYRHTDGKMWIGFTSLMEKLLEEEKTIMEETEKARMDTVRKLIMMSADKRIAMSKFHHCRHIFGLSDDFRDRVKEYPQFFRIVEEQGRRILELAQWDPSLAVTALEASYIGNEEKVKKAFVFPVKYAKRLPTGKDGVQILNACNTLPLVSPYSDNSNLNLQSLEGKKYRVGLIHEFLSLTLEKKASIHHLVEFKDDFKLGKDTYHTLKEQSRTFYLAGTEMNWTLFLKDAYRGEELIEKDPLVVFKEKLFSYGYLKHRDPKLKELLRAERLSRDEKQEKEIDKEEVGVMKSVNVAIDKSSHT